MYKNSGFRKSKITTERLHLFTLKRVLNMARHKYYFFISFITLASATFTDIENYIKNATQESEISDRSYGRIESLLLSSIRAYGCWCRFYDPHLKNCYKNKSRENLPR